VHPGGGGACGTGKQREHDLCVSVARVHRLPCHWPYVTATEFYLFHRYAPSTCLCACVVSETRDHTLDNTETANCSRGWRTRWAVPSCLTRGVRATRLLGLRVRIPPVAWMCFFLGVLCVVRSLCRADHSPRGVLPSMVCLSVIKKPHEWGGPGPLGAFAPWKIYIARSGINWIIRNCEWQD